MEELRAISDPIEWQIDRRYQIQKLLFEILQFLKENKKLPKSADDYWHAITRMVHTGFSLWRSAFLTEVRSTRQGVYDHMCDFVDKVLKHNSITFADDHRMSGLTVDYYNYNARYRLERMMKGPYVKLPALQLIDFLVSEKTEASNMDQSALWDLYFTALRQSFALFRREWGAANSRRKRKRRKT
jgi:hypothetical protein